MTPTLISTSKNAMERFTPEERDCYSEDEISLKYLPRDHGYRYEMSNCLFESAFENILRECKCVPGKKHILWCPFLRSTSRSKYILLSTMGMFTTNVKYNIL